MPRAMADAKDQPANGAVAVDVAALEEKEAGGNREFGGAKDGPEVPFVFSEGLTSEGKYATTSRLSKW